MVVFWDLVFSFVFIFFVMIFGFEGNLGLVFVFKVFVFGLKDIGNFLYMGFDLMIMFVMVFVKEFFDFVGLKLLFFFEFVFWGVMLCVLSDLIKLICNVFWYSLFNYD